MARADSVGELLAAEGDGLLARKERGLWSDALRRLTKNRLAVLALVVLAALTVLVILGNTVDAVQRYDPAYQNYDAVRQDPSWDHFFGTDNLGRDTWARVLQGTLISLQVGIGVQVMVVIIGCIVGGVAALGGRLLDNLMMRLTDIAYAFPDLLFIILLRSVFKGRDLPLLNDYWSDILLMIVAIGFVAWVTVARLVRGQMLSLRERDFVVAARAMGASPARIVFVHMLPNTLSTVIIAVTFGIPLAIFAEAILGFLGFSVDPPVASLGILVSNGYNYIQSQVWMVIFPTATIALLMMCFTFLGDGLRDALDPRTR